MMNGTAGCSSISFSCTCFMRCVTPKAPVLQVNGDGAYRSISEAVAAAPEGATVRVAPGMCVGSVECCLCCSSGSLSRAEQHVWNMTARPQE